MSTKSSMNLDSYLNSITFTIDDDFLNKCEVFIELLQKWGKVHNLSAQLKTYEIEENLIDCIYPLNFVHAFKSLADVGTGAGYPGLMLAMAKSNAKVYLIEPRIKRVAFLNFVKNTLKLDNVEILCNKVEDIENITVDLISSRAVTNTQMLLRLTKNISKDNTSYLFYKGSMLKDELEEAKIKNYKIVNKDKRNYLYIKADQL